jgi:hypothetical protein
MADEVLDRLRARLAGQRGTARNRTLIEIGQRHFEAYWRAGPGRPESRHHLDEAAAVLDEAYGYFAAGDYLRGQVAGLLGLVLGARSGLHGSPDAEREKAIRMLDEALAFPQLPDGIQVNCRLVLGQLLMNRTLRSVQGPDLIARAAAADPMTGESADVGRAIECFRGLGEGATASAEVAAVAAAMLDVAGAMQSLLDAVSVGTQAFDFGRLLQALAALQQVQQRYGSSLPRPGGLPPLPGLNRADDMSRARPEDRMATVVQMPSRSGSSPERPPNPRPRPAPPAAPSAATLLATFRERIGGPRARVWPAVLSLLAPSAARLGVETVDHLVSLATALTAAPDSGAENRLLLAAAYYLRSRVDSGGWGDDDGAEDRQAAARHLLAAREALPGQRADVLGVAYRLATVLDERRPTGDLRSRLADAFTAVTGALRSAGADVLTYPQPDGTLLLVAATGRFEETTPGGPLPGRVVVVGDSLVADGSVVSFVRSAAQVADLAARPRPRLTDRPVFVANPRGDRPQASLDAVHLSRTFYPRSVVVEAVAGVRARLPASMLHLGCGINAGGELELAAGGRLGLRQVSGPGRSGGVAVLPPVPEAGALISALLATNYAGVVGWRAAVPPEIASVMYHLLHLHLGDGGADAVQAVREWIRDPGRTPPPRLPAGLERVVRSSGLGDPAYAAAMVFHGL